MSLKQNYCYKILKKYSLIIDFDGTPTRKTVPSPVEGETYGQWKNRVLGDSASNVVLYTPTEPAHQTRISTLQNRAGAESLEKIFSAFGKTKEKQKKSAINEAIENTEQKYETFSRDTLRYLLEDSSESLEPSVVEFFERFLNTTNPNIDTEKLISDLMTAYNAAVRMYRERS
ncbi:MAG: hypothetical protein Q8S94_00450 [Pseudohongiella sp.]|nr:hypothetical protein [Pseudohongiella sp.]